MKPRVHPVSLGIEGWVSVARGHRRYRPVRRTKFVRLAYRITDMKTEVGVRGFFNFFILFSPLKRHQTSTMQVEDGEDGTLSGRGEGGAHAPAAGARPSEHAAAPTRPASADAIKVMMLALDHGHQSRSGVPGGGSTDDVAGSG